MERDFLGLNFSVSIAPGKETIGDSEFNKASGVQWPVLNRISSLPHLIPSEEEWDKKIGSDFKGSVGQHLKTLNSMPQKDDIHLAWRPPHDIKVHLKPHFGHNFGVSNNLKEQMLGNVRPHSIPLSRGSEQWANNIGAPSQLTIFYNGTVNTFDDVSSDKAEAILLLARNACCPVGQSRMEAAHTPSNSRLDCAGMGQSSPISVSSHPVAHQSRSGSSSCCDDAKTSEPLFKNLDPPTNSVTAKTLMPSAIPQARKASLARFLEKRKERVMNTAAPYMLCKKVEES